MSTLDNSKRVFLQATYTPRKRDDRDDEDAPKLRLKRAWEKWNFVVSLRPSAKELVAVKKRFPKIKGKRSNNKSKNKDTLKTIRLIESSIATLGSLSRINNVKLFRDVAPDTLINIAKELIEVRHEQFQYSMKYNESILKEFYEEQKYIQQQARKPVQHIEKIPDGWQRVDGLVLRNSPAGTMVYRREIQQEVSLEEALRKSGKAKKDNYPMVRNHDDNPKASRHTIGAMMIPPRMEEKPQMLEQLDLSKLSLKTLMDWAIKKGIKSDMAAKTLELAELLPTRPEAMTLADFATLSDDHIGTLNDLMNSLSQQMEIEPVGYLHLERITFTPAGIERGELVHSIPLAPAEEVNVIHREWSNTSEEFEKIVTDSLESFSEEGVTEKSELAQSVSSQEQHSSGLNTGVTASGGYGPVHITATVGYNSSDSSSASQQLSRNQSNTVTRKASTRVKKEHKMSFRTASAAGTEDQTVEKIKNPFDQRPARVDLYQLIRKWKVDLYRYGIRLTFDLIIPDPGSEILDKIIEIETLNELLEQEFTFNLDPYSIKPDNYLSLAGQYNATPDPPPRSWYPIDKAYVEAWTQQDSKRVRNGLLEIDVNEDYYVAEAVVDYTFAAWDRNPALPDADYADVLYDEPTLNPNQGRMPWFIDRWGKMYVIYKTWSLMSFSIEVHMNAILTTSAWNRWKLKVWTTLREAAETQYLESRQRYKEKRTRLLEELGAQDALSLRKIEREEVMKNVIRWLFGPDFRFTPEIAVILWPFPIPWPLPTVEPVPEQLYGSNQAVLNRQIWTEVLSHGRIIRFLHHAIEWENMLYFLYPYFWSHTNRWKLKKYLDHPDPMHKAFLRSGSARVVLTIRPGFEEQFLSLLDEGEFDTEGLPYITIAEEMENHAKTNYPGIQPANPIENFRPLLLRKQQKAWKDMEDISKLLDAFFRANGGTYPTTAQGLAALQPYTEGNPGGVEGVPNVPIQDPWGRNYRYKYPGDHGDYDLASYGVDDQQDNQQRTDENADITNWAEASLIGTWFEYTPTSALDIAFVEPQTLPDA